MYFAKKLTWWAKTNVIFDLSAPKLGRIRSNCSVSRKIVFECRPVLFTDTVGRRIAEISND